jgi:predicted acetyltransferase
MMTDITMRQVYGDELKDAIYKLGGYAFEPTPPMPNREEWDKYLDRLQLATCIALYKGDLPIAAAASTLMTQCVRGKLYAMGGIWGVASHPAYRRNGYVRQVMTQLFTTLRDDNTPLSCLYPFRESFYDRMGYVNLPQPRRAKFKSATLAPLLQWNLGGACELLPAADAFETYSAYIEVYQQRTHGMAEPRIEIAELMKIFNETWVVFARVDGEVVGTMVYTIKGEQGERTMYISLLYYDSPQARYLLLEWVARHIDQVNDVSIKVAPFELPETWLPDMQVETTSRRSPMGRVIDMRNIGGMQTGTGRFTARIRDAQCPWNEGIFTFETVDGALCVREAEAPDCDLDVRALSALIYGSHDPVEFALRGWGSPSPEIQTAMRTMFPPMLAYLHAEF